MNIVNFNEEITKVANELYEKSGRMEGHDLDNWFEAERIVMVQHRVEEKLEAESSSPPKKKKESITKRNLNKTETKRKKN
jgi:hypothetical protein